MLGDHRDNSADVRFFGWVPRRNIVGRAFMIYWRAALRGLPAKEAGGAKALELDPKLSGSIPADGQ